MGRDYLASLKKKNPPAKSPLMQLLTDTMKSNNGGAGDDEGKMMLDGIGCTANVILFDRDEFCLYIANAGDSRCVLARDG